MHVHQAEEVVTSGYKWLRAVGASQFTGLHTDRVFLGRGLFCSQVLITWQWHFEYFQSPSAIASYRLWRHSTV